MITRKGMTRMLLKEGLLSCLKNHSFESITVTLLCKTSGITRSTFYLHYSNIMEIVDDLVDDAIAYSHPGMVDNNNLQIIAKALSAASDSVSLRAAYDLIFDRLPLCQRIIRHKKYLPLFLDEQISEYVLKRIIQCEKDRQGLVMAEALGVSFDVGVSIFLFLVHGLYAVNKQYKWSQSDQWLEAQRIIFEFAYRGLQSK
ncbi:TetR/AcrR family transcriptional regulator [Veillonella caviae]|uniref:TetR/AcrR family transcriptional regulator n=2 Tax=Veillonella caviae TaxID=248316 RepID=UPI0023FA0160|nr:TetR/AcrR family transcriptional regulator [Veillonella caviae]MCI7692900.1 TetR/AcrR family transcriptional regulator [Veillonella caviae]MDD7291014.1 TetR/AcrR family transcriptional regulator [Veillonella caviae]MDY5253909.1 TetR/AcrR family transcriptional regulator [Veillonella caviae]